MARELVESDSSLRLARGWFIDVVWGEQEHWWCVDSSGKIIDPSVGQFPGGAIEELREYREYEGIYPCPGCGVQVQEDSPLISGGFCCGACYGAVIGFGSSRDCKC